MNLAPGLNMTFKTCTMGPQQGSFCRLLFITWPTGTFDSPQLLYGLLCDIHQAQLYPGSCMLDLPFLAGMCTSWIADNQLRAFMVCGWSGVHQTGACLGLRTALDID